MALVARGAADMDGETVTITILKSDAAEIVGDIFGVCGEYHISSDKCDCVARAERIDEALKKAGFEYSE